MIDPNRLFKILIILTFTISLVMALILISKKAYSLDLCKDYIVDERAQGVKNFGLGFPYWYSLGQLKQESACRANATAWDLGQGIAQFMPNTTKYINSLMKENLNPYNPEHAIRMQNYYMALIHRGQKKWSGRLWTSYQEYNGGLSNLSKEFKLAGELDWKLMRDQCHRKVVTLKSGSKLDFCEVNYDYSKKVHKYGSQYSVGMSDGIFQYW